MTPHAFPPPESQIRPVRVLLVDDNPLVLTDLRRLLELSESVQVVGEAKNGLEAVNLAAALSPDVVVMDLEMPDMNGDEATRRIKLDQPTTRVVILTVHAEAEEKARIAGADSFVVKGASYQIMLNAILGRDGSSDSLD